MIRRIDMARVVLPGATLRRVLLVGGWLFMGALLPGCGLLPLKQHKPDPVVARVLPAPTPRTDGAIYQAGQQMELFADLKARRVGDVLTIRLTESTAASKSAQTKTAKTTGVNMTGPTIFGKTFTAAGVPLTTTLNSANSFDGTGSSTQGNSLAGSLTVTVMDVQPNGNLVILGEKTLRLNQGEEIVRVSGVVRSADIATDNTVTSDKIADARIIYSGKGVIDGSNRMGWLARFFNSGYVPY